MVRSRSSRVRSVTREFTRSAEMGARTAHFVSYLRALNERCRWCTLRKIAISDSDRVEAEKRR